MPTLPPTGGQPPQPADKSATQYAADIVRRDAEDRRPEQPRKRYGRQVTAAIVVVLSTALTLWNVERALRQPRVVSSVEEAAAARVVAYLAIQALRTYHDSAKAYPPTLERIGADDLVLIYMPHEATYELIARIGGADVRYRPGDDLAPWRLAFFTLARSTRP